MSGAKQTWAVIDFQVGNPAFNMALDEALLEAAVTLGQPIIRFYGWSRPAATFGYFQSYQQVSTWTPLRPLIRRPTGGGLVPHTADWTYSVIIPPGLEWYQCSAVESYQRLHEWVSRALATIGIETKLTPATDPSGPGQCFVGAEKFDLLSGQTKIAGAAQRRNKLGLLIQGSIQPRPNWGDRDAWHHAMMQNGSKQGVSEAFQSFRTPVQILDRANHLTEQKYNQSSYLERR